MLVGFGVRITQAADLERECEERDGEPGEICQDRHVFSLNFVSFGTGRPLERTVPSTNNGMFHWTAQPNGYRKHQKQHKSVLKS